MKIDLGLTRIVAIGCAVITLNERAHSTRVVPKWVRNTTALAGAWYS